MDRPALAVRMVFSADGRKLRHTFHRVMMRSAARLSYPQAQAAIDGRPDETTAPILDTVLKPLWDGYAVLKRGRDKRQPLDLDLPERKILLKPDGTVDRVIVPERLDAHRLIEEFMIQANVAAAETLESKRQTLVYRVHDSPSLAKQESLREFLQLHRHFAGARRRTAHRRSSTSILDRVRDGEHEALVNEVVLRTQSQADLLARQSRPFRPQSAPLRAFHFADPPLCRPDRSSRADFGALPGQGRPDAGRGSAHCDDISGLISSTERRAMAAERETVDRLIAAHLAERINGEFDGRDLGRDQGGTICPIAAVRHRWLCARRDARRAITMYSTRRRGLWSVNEPARASSWPMPCLVKLVDVAPLAGALRFEMLSEPKPCRAPNVRSTRRSAHATARTRLEASTRPARQEMTMQDRYLDKSRFSAARTIPAACARPLMDGDKARLHVPLPATAAKAACSRRS